MDKYKIYYKYNAAKRFLKENNIHISTMTIDCKLNTDINIKNMEKYCPLTKKGINSKKYGNRDGNAKTKTIKLKKKTKKKSLKNFYNQITVLISPTNSKIKYDMNIKIFKNGSLQITGCKDMHHFHNVIDTLIEILKTSYELENKEYYFTDNPDAINLTDVNIRMIVSYFWFDFKIDRKNLFYLINKYHYKNTTDTEFGYIESTFNPMSGHSCVNIKHQYNEAQKTSIFVFQTGAIIITGAKNLQHIIAAYQFIDKLIHKYYKIIKIVELDIDLVKKAIKHYFKKKATLVN